jgi:hypothetical protein
MNSKEICIIGAGNGGSAMAGDLTLAGHRCRIFEFPEYAENIHPVISQGGIEVTGIARTGFARIALVTDEITRGFIKPYPMCRFGHPAIEAAQELIRHYPIDPEEIETVEVRTFDLAAACNEKLPKTELAAKFSVPWAVASMLVRKSSGLDDFRDEGRDPCLTSHPRMV